MAIKQYFGVGGVARNIKEGNFGVGGVARKVTSGYEGIGGVARQFLTAGDGSLPAKGMPLESYTWAEISAVSRAGKAKEYWSVGDTKSWTYSSNTCYAQIVGFDHDRVNEGIITPDNPYPRQYAGITFELCGRMGETGITSVLPMTLPYQSDISLSGYKGYKTSALRESVMLLSANEYVNAAGISDVVVPVEKSSVASDKTDLIVEGDTFFIPSISELVGVGAAPLDEGEQYELYSNKGIVVSGNATALCRYGGGTARVWWTRTLSVTSTNMSVISKGNAYVVTGAGAFTTSAVNTGRYISPMFCV